ncbi:hypothetical protein AB0J68_24005, partial [Micromonospora sp. NPDC049580]|uniref:hypothetical protein n=1 Tax=Micromonospora sp. NPDC049580 TaxID=3154832 RepID=UPI00342481D9
MAGLDTSAPYSDVIDSLAGGQTILVDALDEADGPVERTGIAEDLVELSALPSMRVVVATRSVSVADAGGPDALLSSLLVTSSASPAVVNLDDDRYFHPADLRQFALALLCQDGAPHPGPAEAAWMGYRADP